MHLPQATYRIQLNSSFDFNATKRIIPYLKDLGISHLYASPIFRARRGSAHGYDVVDLNSINPELGGKGDFLALVEAVKKEGLFWLQDIVPNHMAYASENQMLMDVFENGQDSEYSEFFDIDWKHKYENMQGRILAPLLGAFYAECLENGQIQLRYDEGGLNLSYYALTLPVRVSSYATFFEYNIGALEQELSGADSDFIKFLGVINLFKSLACKAGDAALPEQMKHAKVMLWSLYCENAAIKKFIKNNLVYFNGTKGNPSSFDALDKLISEQFYRLSFWKVAAEEINYRRFFTVNELICLRVENEEVLRRTHRFIFECLKQNLFDGLRIDHIDGLFDPCVYLKKLRERSEQIYMVVEKVLAPGEKLPSPWPVQGTTGYDFLNYVNGIFCQQENQKAFSRIYRRFCSLDVGYDDLLREKKRLIISRHLAGNVDNLAHMLKQLSGSDRYGSDITLYGLRRALVEVMASFPVYRTYIDYNSFSESDKSYIRVAIETARRELPAFTYELNFIEKFLLLQFNGGLSDEQRRPLVDFVMNFQQYTSPLMAKGFEDTFLYVYNRLVSLNEVGSSPDRFGFSLEEYHAFVKDNAARGEYPLNASSTHDTKRGEDVRARINVLSEIPDEWEGRLKEWARLNRKAKTKYEDILAPDANDEYFLYQTLIGTMQSCGVNQEFRERIKDYCIKAVRESKRHTAWIRPDEAYEQACIAFIERILDGSERNPFLENFMHFQKKIAYYGAFNSLSQTLLKITAPGAADFYQGAEKWDFSLVDPDNRGPVDFEKRIQDLKYIKERECNRAALIQECISEKEDGRIKLFLVYKSLEARNQHADIFQDGEYIPLKVRGKFSRNIIAFMRKIKGKCALVVAPRHLCGIINEGELPLGKEKWQDTALLLPDGSSGAWKDAITNQSIQIGEEVLIGDILSGFPVGLLIKEGI